MNEESFKAVIEFLKKVPSVSESIAYGEEQENWWIKFRINLEHKLAWNVIQEFGHVLNYISIEEKLPTNFYPVSPPPYMNGGPKEFLSWVIENTNKEFTPIKLLEWLEGRLPVPVENEDEWEHNDE
jgi:hypothetical protein